MHRAIGYLSKRFVQIRPGEGRKVLLTFLYFFLIITAYYVIKPVSRSLVLGELGSRLVPYVDLVCAILMGPLVTLFATLVDRIPKPRLVSYSFWAVIGVLMVFWRLLHWPVPWVAGVFYVWVAVFSVLVVTLFWLVANDLYRAREAKRLFGFIGSGGILGGIVGSSIAAVGAQIVGTDHLLLLSAGVLVCCWVVVQQLWMFAPGRLREEISPGHGGGAPGGARSATEETPPHCGGDGEARGGPPPARRGPPRPEEISPGHGGGVARSATEGGPPRPEGHPAHRPARRDTFLADIRGFARLLTQSRYLLLLVAIVALNKIVATLVYYQLNPFIETTFPDQDAKTTFTGMFFGGMNIAAFMIQFFLTSWILRRLGMLVALLVLPVTVLTGAAGLLVLPVFWLAATTELFDGSLNYSLQQTTKEVLYLPIDRSIRYKVKPFIDMVVFRFGKGGAAILGIVLLDVLHISPYFLSYVTVPLLITWLVVAVWLHRDYVSTIRTMLQARAASRRSSARPAKPVDLPPETGEPFGSLTDGQPSVRKLELVDRLVGEGGAGGAPSPLAQELLQDLTDYELRCADPAELERDPRWLRAVITDPSNSMATRRQAVLLLSRFTDPRTLDYLFAIVMLEGDALLRQEAVRALVRLRLRGVPMEQSPKVIQRLIGNEVAEYQRVAQVEAVYRHHHPRGLIEGDPAIGLFQALREESVEQIFRLLMLIYRPEDIHLIYEQLRASDGHLRTDAIELLDNLVDPPMRATLMPILDEDPFLALGGEGAAIAQESAAAYRILQEAIWNHNCWLSVTTLCAVGRLRLTSMRQELERASRHRAPLISTAAKVALHLSTLP
jgi:AAA family ATP:ADP antiporter